MYFAISYFSQSCCCLGLSIYDPYIMPDNALPNPLHPRRPYLDRYDVCIVGGGCMGSSLAYHLASQDPHLRVCVVEKDSSYRHASTSLSVGSLRLQFSNRENVELSRYRYLVIYPLALLTSRMNSSEN